MSLDHRKLLAEFKKRTGKEKGKFWRKWKKDITNFHLTIVISTSDEYYQLDAWKLLKKSKPEISLLKTVVKHTTVEEVRLAAAKLLVKKSVK